MRLVLLICLVAMGLLAGSAPQPLSLASAQTLGTQSSGRHFKMVRSEYVDLEGNHDHIDTVCHIVNRSATQSIVLDNVFILGPDGTNSILGLYTGFAGTVLPPLGAVKLPIDSNIPGVAPQTDYATPGVTSVVVSFFGTADTLKLSAVLDWYRPSDDRSHNRYVHEGYDVGP